MDKQAALKKGIQEFNDGDYFECHETLEDVWMIEVGPDRPFYQGLLQLSVGCFHLLNRNYVGAESQWSKAHAKLQAFGDEHLGVELKSLIEQILCCQEMLAMVQRGQRREFDLSIIPHIQCT
jgi:predicted metal-dependent hydrolase